MTWRAMVVLISAVLPMLASKPAQAFMIPPPALLQIRFDAASGELTSEGRLAADRLAVRAAQCRDGRLRVLLRHEAGTRPEQVVTRYRAVQQRMAKLGVDAIYVNRALSSSEGGSAASAWASVSSGDDHHCSQVDSSLLQRWADQLARHALQPAGHVPRFWSRMSASVRRDELALILAATSYCAAPEGGMARGLAPHCTPHPEAFDWLAERTARLHAGEQRERWVEILWSAADASTLERWRRRLGISTLSPEAVLRWVPAMMASDLPWEEIERRLLMPGLMSRVGRESLYARFPFAGDVVRGAVDRRQFDALARMIEAAGEEAPGLQWEIVIAAADTRDDADFEQLMHLLPVGFPIGLWNGRVTELLLIGANCPGAQPGLPQRYARIWERLRSLGFVPDGKTLESLTSPRAPGNQGGCRIEAVPGEAYRFRGIVQS